MRRRGSAHSVLGVILKPGTRDARRRHSDADEVHEESPFARKRGADYAADGEGTYPGE